MPPGEIDPSDPRPPVLFDPASPTPISVGCAGDDLSLQALDAPLVGNFWRLG